jgi:hypothetical protein
MSTTTKVQGFYENELGKLGWKLLATGDTDNSTLLIFIMEDMSTCSVTIFPLEDGLMYVELIK